MQLTKRITLILACYFISFYAPAEESSGGLLFTSSKEKVDKRTSLVLFGEKLQRFDDSFSISFDLSLWDSSLFGHIFRVINNHRREVEFVFVNFYGTDSMYLDFHSPITHESVQIPITQKDIDTKEVLRFNIHFDLKADKASITLRDSVYTCSPVGLENPSHLKIAFGLFGLNLDVPQMLIKNLRISGDRDKDFFFPLEEPEGDIAYDKNEGEKARVKNPEWIINKHFYWHKKTEIRVKDKACVTFDELNNRILTLSKSGITAYHPRYEKTVNYQLRELTGASDVSDALYNPVKQQCYIFNNRVPTSPSTILNNLKFLNVDEPDDRHLTHHSSFFSAEGDFYRFGGYGSHTYTNKVSRYNAETRQLEFVDFRGDRITPRFYSAVGDGINPDEKLIFGGFGNETGRQEHGGHNLYDLHVLNLRQQTISRLWTLTEIPKTEFIPGNNLILSSDKKYFYALCYAHHLPKTAGLLYRFNIENGSYEVMSDSIHFNSEGMNTTVNLFYNEKIGEFYAVIREYTESTNENRIQIFSLLSPPITEAYLKNILRSPLPVWWIVLAASLLLIAGAGVYLYLIIRRRRKTALENIPLEAPHLAVKDDITRKSKKDSAVYVFGNFTVYDKKGTDISYRFSMKLRALFSLVLLNTEGNTGISTEILTLALWPDKDLNGAKNIRGVTINRLRNILEDIDGITLVHQNHQWFFIYEDPFYCDFIEYSTVLKGLEQSTGKDTYLISMEQLVEILRNGSFLFSVQDPGVDTYKSKEEEKLSLLLKDYFTYLFGDKQYAKVIQLAPTFFATDPLNEHILEMCIKSYQKLGKKEELKSFMKYYKRTHKMLTGEEFKEGKKPAESTD